MPASVGAPHVCMSEHVWNTTYGLEDAVTIGEELTGELVGLSRQKHSTSIGTHNLGMYGPSIAQLALLIALLDGATGQHIGHVLGTCVSTGSDTVSHLRRSRWPTPAAMTHELWCDFREFPGSLPHATADGRGGEFCTSEELAELLQYVDVAEPDVLPPPPSNLCLLAAPAWVAKTLLWRRLPWQLAAGCRARGRNCGQRARCAV